jgi:hypothetical protein
MEVPYSEPLKLEPHHKLTLSMDSTCKGRMNCNLSTKCFHTLIICPHTLEPKLKTCPLTIAQLILGLQSLCWEGLHLAKLNLSKDLRLESPGSKAVRTHLHSKAKRASSGLVRPNLPMFLCTQQSPKLTLVFA